MLLSSVLNNRDRETRGRRAGGAILSVMNLCSGLEELRGVSIKNMIVAPANRSLRYLGVLPRMFNSCKTLAKSGVLPLASLVLREQDILYCIRLEEFLSF
jgi:hypothetical protein